MDAAEVEPTERSDPHIVALREGLGLITPNDLAGIIGVGARQLQVWRSENIGPDYVKLGKQIFYRRADVTSWIEANVRITKRREV